MNTRTKRIIFSTVALTGLMSGTLMVSDAIAAKSKPTPACTGYYALTFDDGPAPLTAQYINALKSVNAKGVFFVNGYKMDWWPGLQKMANTKQQIGNHTENHVDLTTVDAATFTSEIDKTQARIAAVGAATNLLRPPYGATNATVRQQIEAKGYIQVMWSVDTKDWTPEATVDSIVAQAMTIKNGGLLLMHENKPNTLAAIPKFVNQLRKTGLCPGKVVKSDTEHPTDHGIMTMNAVAVKP